MEKYWRYQYKWFYMIDYNDKDHDPDYRKIVSWWLVPGTFED